MAHGTQFTHLDDAGKASMVDVSGKVPVKRTAKASCRIYLSPSTIALIRGDGIPKGDVLATARIAGIMAGKHTSDLIPLCHNISIDKIGVDFHILEDHIEIQSVAVCVDKTGIEMEALTAVSVAALTIWDMCKAVDKTMHIDGITLNEKTKRDL